MSEVGAGVPCCDVVEVFVLGATTREHIGERGVDRQGQCLKLLEDVIEAGDLRQVRERLANGQGRASLRKGADLGGVVEGLDVLA